MFANLSFNLILLTSPFFASVLPIAAPSPLTTPQAHNPTTLMGRTIILRSAVAEAEAVDFDADAIPNRAERFALRMKYARRLGKRPT